MKIRKDFVTNSSSSSFVCQKNMSIEDVKERLEKMIEFYNYMMDDHVEFDQIFTEPYALSSEDVNEKSYWDGCINGNIGKAFVMSAYENSIPYFLFHIIEEVFDTDIQRL